MKFDECATLADADGHTDAETVHSHNCRMPGELSNLLKIVTDLRALPVVNRERERINDCAGARSSG